jgi:hypothetical protein
MEGPSPAWLTWETTVARIVVSQWRRFTGVLVPHRLQLARAFLAVEVRTSRSRCVSRAGAPLPHSSRAAVHTSSEAAAGHGRTTLSGLPKPSESLCSRVHAGVRRRADGDGCWL